MAANIYAPSIFLYESGLCFLLEGFREGTFGLRKWRNPVSVPLDDETRTLPRNLTAAKESSAEPSTWLRIASLVLRTAFIVLLAVVIAHVSMPQSETLWTIFDTPGDVVRLLLGLAACGWLAVQLFTVPNDVHAHRTWVRLGMIAVPFLLICILAIW
jgi:hypothetical protein